MHIFIFIQGFKKTKSVIPVESGQGAVASIRFGVTAP